MAKNNRQDITSFMCNHDLNWYYNGINIKNYSGIVEPTVGFIDGERKGIFKTIDFLNLVQWHYKELQSKAKTPIDFIEHLNSLPLKKNELHLLMAVLLKWYGGIPVVNESDPYYIIRKLVEKEFLDQYPGKETPEKSFAGAINRKVGE